MAGAGFKTFNTGDVLTASDVNTYLMQQTVMVFDDAAARTTALTGVVAEGMLSYLKDTNAVEVYDGSSWVASDDPNAIQNSIVDAKGDLISATADNTPSRLAVGADNTVLTADSSTSTGLKWATAAGGNKTYTLLNTGGTALSGSSEVTVNVTTKEDYAVFITDIAVGVRTDLQMRINGDTGSNYTTVFNRIDADPSTITPAMIIGSSTTTTSIYGGTRSDNASSTMTFALFVSAGNSTTYHPYTFTSGASPAGGDEHVLRWGHGIYSGSAAITSFTIRNVSASNFTGGTIYVYGA